MSMDITTDQGFKELTLLRHQAKLAAKPLFVFIGPAPEKTITSKQFNALHVWCEMVAESLNAAGLDQRIVLKPSVAIDWSKDSVKQYLFKPLLEAMTGKTSTTDQDTVEPSKVADTMARHLGEKFGITLPEWPKR